MTVRVATTTVWLGMSLARTSRFLLPLLLSLQLLVLLPERVLAQAEQEENVLDSDEIPWWQQQQVEPLSCNATADISDNTLNEALEYLEDNQTLLLRSGVHCIQNFTLVSNVSNIAIVGPANESAATIRCFPGIGLAFYRIFNFTLLNIRIESCGMNLKNTERFLVSVRNDINFFFKFHNDTQDQHVAIAVGNSKNVVIKNCQVVNTDGLGFLGINLVGLVIFDKVVFDGNGIQCSRTITSKKLGGGALISYHDYLSDGNDTDADEEYFPETTVKIVDSWFNNNNYCGFENIFYRYTSYFTYSNDVPLTFLGPGGGLTLQLTQLRYQVQADITDSCFTNNTSIMGSGTLIAIYAGVSNSEVNFSGCKFEQNGVVFSNYKDSTLFSVFGSGMAIVFDYVQPDFSVEDVQPDFFPSSVMVKNCSFNSNHAFSGTLALFSLFAYVVPFQRANRVELVGCTFQNNQAVNGPAIYALEQKFNPYKPGATLSLCDMIIVGNELVQEQQIESPLDSSGVIHLANLNASFSGSNSLSLNDGSALKLASSLVFFQGNATFFNNSAAYGGAIQAVGASYIIFLESARVRFSNNVAAVAGGAIYVKITTLVPDPQASCFIGFEAALDCFHRSHNIGCGDITKLGTRIIFEGNKASLGSVLYGVTLEDCLWAINFTQTYFPESHKNETSLFELLYKVQQNSSGDINVTIPFHFSRLPDNVAEVATPVWKLGAFFSDSSDTFSNFTLAPGIKKKVELAAYDRFNRLVPSAATSAVHEHGIHSVLGSNYTFINYNSTDVTSFHLTTSTNLSGSSVNVSLFTVEPYSAELTVVVTFEDCPEGFYFNSTNRNCTCYESLPHFNIYCTENGKLLVPINKWVGPDSENRLNHMLCSFDYCESSVSIVNRNSSNFDGNSQCNLAYNRHGLGCGSCANGYSLTLGSNGCLVCNNTYLLFIPVFALYAILLFLVIMNARLSISTGFINALLFFSNIVSLYGSVYTRNFSSYFVMFHWLSLKVGFQTCLYDGMKPLHLAALNFIYPVYLYLLLLLIYVTAAKSSRFSTWLSRRRCTPTHLFVTVLIMTYSSLLESCVQVLSVTTVTIIKENGTKSQLRWRHDPSQGYFEGYHAILAVFSVVILTLFLVPLPFVFMLNVMIRKLRFLSRYKPFYDAAWAPFKTPYRFWVGMRLLLRIPPLFFFYLSSSPVNLFSLALFLLVISFLHGMVQPYQGIAQNIFDGFLMLSLTMVTVVSLYYSLLLGQVGVLDELGDIDAINRKLDEYEFSQRVAVMVLMTVVYVACAAMVVWQLLFYHPHWTKKIKSLLQEMWHKATCRARPKERVEMNPTFTDFLLPEETRDSDAASTYGTIQEMQMPRPSTATFSELRESLLEDSTTGREIAVSDK